MHAELELVNLFFVYNFSHLSTKQVKQCKLQVRSNKKELSSIFQMSVKPTHAVCDWVRNVVSNFLSVLRRI